ncbi:MAG: DUF6132 family protein [Candidatus Cyclobacteriaceae bacterium M3_2C_046]
MEKLKKLFLGMKDLRLILGLLIGGAAGYLYYFFIGCTGGSCAITSNPWSSILFGMLFGVILLKK